MAKKNDLIKEAIADAKSLQAVALENAKKTLAEAFTPQLQSMLSNKLQQEMEGDDEDEEDLDLGGAEDGIEDAEDDLDLDGEEDLDLEEGDEDLDLDDEDDLDLDGEEDLDLDGEEDLDLDEDEDFDLDGEDDLDLEEDLDLEDEDDDLDLGGDEEEDELDLELESILSELDAITEDDDMELDGEEDEENLELESLRKENADLRDELEESAKAIKAITGTVNEVKLLNVKLIYTNQLFRNHTLSENQKLRVITHFDKTDTVKEAKLVFETLSSSLTSGSRKKSTIKEGAASRAAGKSTAKKKTVMNESTVLKNRFMRLANVSSKVNK